MTRVEGLPGTRDFYPPEMRLRRWIESRWREVALRYGFEEVDGPAIEPLELFTVKSGEAIVEQLYAFEDRGGRRVALRPEMTPTLARMVAARSQGLPKPIKWFSIPRLFRYERPQRGRFREFWQLNLDVFGVAGIEADAEIIAAGVDVLRACGLGAEDFVVRYSDRRLLDRALERLAVPVERWPAAFLALDKLLRAGPEEARGALARAGVPERAAGTLVEAVGRRERAAFETALAGVGVDVAAESAELAELEDRLGAYGVAPFCTFDAAVVRGLAYYTGVVFEIYDRAGELRAICGGGRYDDLLEGLGGERLPAVGFGLGEAVLSELLERVGAGPPEVGRCQAYVIPVSAGERLHAIGVAARLRQAGVRTDLALRDASVGRGLKSAAQAGARVAIVIGERERQQGTLTLRDLASGEETSLGLEEGVAHLVRRGGGGVRIGLVSDTHDHVLRIREAVSLLNRLAVDAVLHAGDYCSPFAVRELGRLEAPLHGVWGNNDGDVYRLGEAFAAIGARLEWQWWETELDGRRILLMHEPRGVDAMAAAGEHDLVVYGHTHERDERAVGRTRIVNPGEVCGWLGGVPSFAIYDTRSGEVEFHEF